MENIDYFFDSLGWWHVVILMIFFSALGFVRNRIDNRGPGIIVNVKDVTDFWLAEPNWVSRISLLFIPFGYILNFLSWVVFGIYSIYDLLAYLLKLIWWVLVFIWNEILNPGLFTVIRLVWHYLIGFAFNFFKFSFAHVKSSFLLSNYIFVVKHLFVLGLFVFLGAISFSFVPNIWVLVVYFVLALFWYQFISFQSVAYFKNDLNVKKNIPVGMQFSFIWFLILAVSFLILYLYYTSSSSYLLSAVGMLSSQLLIPVTLILIFTFISGLSFLPAYISRFPNNIKTGSYLKSTFFRFPKLFYAQLFQVPGLVLVGIIPLAATLILSDTTKVVSGKDFNQWLNELSTIGQHIPKHKAIKNEILGLERDIYSIEGELKDLKNSFDEEVSKIDYKIEDAERLKSDIKDYNIHSYSGNFYVGETQFFSVPNISECSQYKWRIEKGGRLINQIIIPDNSRNKSISIGYTWRTSGEYKISLVPTNRCGNSSVITRNVNVLDRPRFRNIQRPVGQTSVCKGDRVLYRAESGFDSYEWRHPFGEENTTNNQLSLVWGDISGTVQVRGKYRNQYTPWKGINVYIQTLPNQSERSGKFLDDETVPKFTINRAFVFQTREAATDSIQKLYNIRNQLRDEFEQSNDLLNDEKSENSIKIKEARIAIADNKTLLVGKYVAAFGFSILITLLFPPLFIFFKSFNFELFEYKQEGEHYYQDVYKELNSKNPNQPYLAFFISLVLTFAIYWIGFYIN